MKMPGARDKFKYWGRYTVDKVAQLRKPVKCHSKEIGTAYFHPAIVKLKWDKPPSKDKNNLWFPYWIEIKGKYRYGQYAPMIGEKALVELFRNAHEQGFFTKYFARQMVNIFSK